MMDLTEKNIKRISLIFLFAVLILLAIMIIWPVLGAIIGGLLAAYIVFPIYNWLKKKLKSRNLSAILVIILIILIVVLPLWFLSPYAAKEVFNIFLLSQKLDVQNFVELIFPGSSQEFVVQISVSLNSIISKATSGIFNFLVNIFLDIPKLLLSLFVAGFVLFFSLRDSDKLKDFIKRISPFTSQREKEIVRHFKDMTDSIVYGQVISGIVQGGLAGLGFLLFGVPNALLLTCVAILLSILPFLGPTFIWIPVTIYMVLNGNYPHAVGYFVYNILIVSTLDNFIRAYIVSKKMKISQAVILVGMIGGIYFLGILGLIVGPLIISYLVTLVDSYKNKSVYSLLSE